MKAKSLSFAKIYFHTLIKMKIYKNENNIKKVELNIDHTSFNKENNTIDDINIYHLNIL